MPFLLLLEQQDEAALTTELVFPAFVDEVAFASDPFDTPQLYTAVTSYVKQRSFRRGRQNEDERPSTGSSGHILTDDERRFDPENGDSDLYPNVLPMRRVRCSATLGGVTYDVGVTFVDTERGWERAETSPGFVDVTVPGNDGFDVLASAFLTADDSFPPQKSGERIDAILDAIDWPAAERDIDVGQEDVQAVAAPDAATDALTLIQDAADTEPGFFFIDQRGYAVFHDRHRRLRAPYTVSQATFADGPNVDVGRLPYARLQTRQSKIKNDVRVTPNGLDEQAAEDADSIRIFRRRTLSLSTLHTTVAHALSSARWRLSRSKDSDVRYEELELQPANDVSLWEQILARKIGDRITIIRTPPGGDVGDIETKDCHIEAISLDAGPGVAAKCVWRLSPASQTTYWIAGVAGFDEAGITTRAVY